MFLGFGERGSDFEKQVFLAEKKANKAKAEHNKNASEFFASPEKELSSELNEAVETAANKLSENTEELKALVEASFPDRTEQEREQILTQLQSVEGRTKFKGFIKNYIFQALPIDITVGSVAGFIAPILARMALKNSARVFLASKTFGVSVAAGAIASAIVEPIRHWWSNRKKIVAKDIEWQLDAAEKSSDQAAIVAKAQKDLHAGKFRKEDEASVKKLLQDQIVKLHLETNQEKIEGLSEKDKVLQILKMSQGARRELLTAGGREARRIINKIEFLTEKNKVTVKELAGVAF